MSSEKNEETLDQKQSYYSMYSYSMIAQNRDGELFQEEKYDINNNGEKDNYYIKTMKNKDNDPIMEENGNRELPKMINTNFEKLHKKYFRMKSFFDDNFFLPFCTNQLMLNFRNRFSISSVTPLNQLMLN